VEIILSKRWHHFGGEALDRAHLVWTDQEQLEVVDAQALAIRMRSMTCAGGPARVS